MLPTATLHDQVKDARKDLLERLGSKSLLAELVATLLDFSQPLLLHPSHLTPLLDAALTPPPAKSNHAGGANHALSPGFADASLGASPGFGLGFGSPPVVPRVRGVARGAAELHAVTRVLLRRLLRACPNLLAPLVPTAARALLSAEAAPCPAPTDSGVIAAPSSGAAAKGKGEGKGKAGVAKGTASRDPMDLDFEFEFEANGAAGGADEAVEQAAGQGGGAGAAVRLDSVAVQLAVQVLARTSAAYLTRPGGRDGGGGGTNR